MTLMTGYRPTEFKLIRYTPDTNGALRFAPDQETADWLDSTRPIPIITTFADMGLADRTPETSFVLPQPAESPRRVRGFFQALGRTASNAHRSAQESLNRAFPPIDTDTRGGADRRAYLSVDGDTEFGWREMDHTEVHVEMDDRPFVERAASLLSSRATYNIFGVEQVDPEIAEEAFARFETENITPDMVPQLLTSLHEAFRRRLQRSRYPILVIDPNIADTEHSQDELIYRSRALYMSVREARIAYDQLRKSPYKHQMPLNSRRQVEAAATAVRLVFEDDPLPEPVAIPVSAPEVPARRPVPLEHSPRNPFLTGAGKRRAAVVRADSQTVRSGRYQGRHASPKADRTLARPLARVVHAFTTSLRVQ